MKKKKCEFCYNRFENAMKLNKHFVSASCVQCEKCGRFGFCNSCINHFRKLFPDEYKRVLEKELNHEEN